MIPENSSLPRVAQAEEWRDAFHLLFHKLSPVDRLDQTSRLLKLIHQGEMNPQGIHVLPGRTGLVGTFVHQVQPGGVAMVWPPGFSPTCTQTQVDSLVRFGLDRLRQIGIPFAQCLLAEEEVDLVGPLIRQGFHAVTRLHLLQKELSGKPVPLPSIDWSVRPYDSSDPGEFWRTLEKTFEGSLDFPEVNGLRKTAEIKAGHLAQSRGDTSQWFLARSSREAAGVLIGSVLYTGDWELAYLGVVPDARRKGVAQALLNQFHRQAEQAGVPRLLLAVDERNQPARQFYSRNGFIEYDRRHVFLAFLGRG